MKVILNKDLATLGEEGDVRDVAKGYARNYLFPRSIAMPYNEGTIRLFEARKGEIEVRKAEKRDAARGLKERLEALELTLSMPAGANGRLFGSVTSQTVAEELNRQGFQIERKRIELPGTTFKSVGKYKVTIHLYESASAELTVAVQALVEKIEESPARGRRRRPEDRVAPRVDELSGTGEGAPAPGAETAEAVPETAEGAVPADAGAAETGSVETGEAQAGVAETGSVPDTPQA
jgi:large subunit ribosomal protein L9